MGRTGGWFDGDDGVSCDMAHRDHPCSRCSERPGYCKGMCQRCYYATRHGRATYAERLTERNFLRNGVGVLTDGHGGEWIVDPADFEACRVHFWIDNGVGYAKSQRAGYIHRFLMPGVRIVDHIDRNPRNNRRSNLRDGHGINQLNTPHRPSQSGVRGVHRMRDKWQAAVTVDGVKHRLGTYATVEEAQAAVRRFAAEVGRTEFYRRT